jgi:hypothetical protein
LHRCLTWTTTGKEEHKFDYVWTQKTGSNYQTENNCIMRNLRVYSLPNVTQVIKLRKMKWAGKVACKGTTSKPQNLKGRNFLKDQVWMK